MNCKPGDLAVIVKGINQGDQQHIGKIIRVDSLMPPELAEAKGCGGDPYWFFNGQTNRAANDSCLKPIRDPGDDAEDEMVTLMKTKEKENV